MSAFFHDDYQTSAGFRWRNKHNVVIWHHPNAERKNEHHAARTGSPLVFSADSQEAAERKCAEHFGLTHYKDQP